MKHFMLVSMLGIILAVGGCTSVPNPGGGGGTTTDFDAIIAQVQKYSQLACGFVPTAATVANIISGGNPGVMAATSIAQAVCSAVAPPLKSGRQAFVAKNIRGWHVTPGAVNGVTIQGERTR